MTEPLGTLILSPEQLEHLPLLITHCFMSLSYDLIQSAITPPCNTQGYDF